MGICHGKQTEDKNLAHIEHLPNHCSPRSTPLFTKKHSPSRSSPFRAFKRPPPSPAKHINAFLARRNALVKKPCSETETSIPDSETCRRRPAQVVVLDKNFGYPKNFFSKYEMGDEIGRGYFGYTTRSKVKKGELKGQEVAVKVMPKAKMNTTIAIEDVRREVRILSTIAEHKNLVRFHEAFEDEDNVYIVMELCTGGELLDRMLLRGGKYMEEEAKAIIVQILSVTSFCHLQGVVHRDLKPENFLFSSKDETSLLKAIDFGLSDFIKPEERLNDIVGSSYYVAPEVLHRSYGTEADMWSIGVISYILLCGIRPFWDRRESGIFRAVLKAEPCFEEEPWPSLSSDAKDFVKNLLVKDYRRRMTAVQALCHPWISRNQEIMVPFDILVLKLVKAYITSSDLKKSALRALAKTTTLSQLSYLQRQFTLLGPNKNGYISIQNFKMVLKCISTDAMKESKVLDFINSVSSLEYRKMSFDEFAAAAISVHQLEGSDNWEKQARCAYEQFDKNDNRPITIDELTSELGVGVSISIHSVLLDWIRHSDGKLSFLGFIKLLHGSSPSFTPTA